MTAGLALADILSEQTSDYKDHTAYFGIDASRNMVNKAKCINTEHALFKHFEAVQDTRFDSQQIPSSFPTPQIIVLCFSFVLAPKTYKGAGRAKNAIEQFVSDWKEYVGNQPAESLETRIICLNPLDTYFHDNWGTFKETMRTQGAAGEFCYTPDNSYTSLPVEGCVENIYYYMIHGARKRK